MKILVFADIHGSTSAMDNLQNIVNRERPDKTVICGDLFGGWASTKDIVAKIQQIDSTLYLVRGNNDYESDCMLLPFGMEENVLMYHFGRTLFFTHGHVYNKYRIPPLLKEGDALIYGHTHMSLIQRYNGLHVLNVGSLSRPRDNTPCYLVLKEEGATLCDLNGAKIVFLPWSCTT